MTFWVFLTFVLYVLFHMMYLSKTNRRFTFQRERRYYFEPDQRKSSSNTA